MTRLAGVPDRPKPMCFLSLCTFLFCTFVLLPFASVVVSNHG